MSQIEGGAVAAIESLCHTTIANCYQCGKCTAGCPMSAHMDAPPHRLIRMIHLDQTEKALRSESIWQCVSCQTCSARCPKEVDCAGIMDALRQISFERGYVSPSQRIVMLFQKAFLDNIRRNGRINELELIGQFKSEGVVRDRKLSLLFKDAGLAPQLMKRGKLHLLPEKAKDRAVVGRIFERCMGGPKK